MYPTVFSYSVLWLFIPFICAEQHSNSPNCRWFKMSEALVIMTGSFHLSGFPTVIVVFHLCLMTSWTRRHSWMIHCVSILYYRSSVHGGVLSHPHFQVFTFLEQTNIICNLTQDGCRWYQIRQQTELAQNLQTEVWWDWILRLECSHAEILSSNSECYVYLSTCDKWL